MQVKTLKILNTFKSLSVKTFKILEFQIANSYYLNISSEANLCFMCFKTAATTRVKFEINFKIKMFYIML